MSIILFGSTKGGVGKSTLCANVAVALAEQAYDCMIVDADQQASITGWWADRKIDYPDKTKIWCIQKYLEIDTTLEDLSTRYQHVLVDVPGRSSEELRSALSVADIVIIPVKPSKFDMDSFHQMNILISKARGINKKMQCYAVINLAPTNPKGTEIEEARSVIALYPDVTQLQQNIFDRKCYRDSIALGLSVLELPEKSNSIKLAQNEIRALVKEVIKNDY